MFIINIETKVEIMQTDGFYNSKKKKKKIPYGEK